MSYFQPFSISHNNPEADDSSTVFDADTVTPDEVPSTSLPPPMPPLPAFTATATATDYNHQQQNNNETICRCPHSSQEESPRSFTTEFLRLINSQRSPAEPSTTTAAATATATRTEEKEISTNESSSSSSSKKRSIITNSSSHSSRKKTRRSSRLKRQQPQDQNCTDDKSDEEVEDENGLEDYEPDEETVTNQLSSSSSSQTSTTKELSKRELKWRSKFEELRAYKRSNGHTNVPKSNKQLGLWVMTQRAEYRKLKDNKKSQITPERIQTLESIGFEWVSPNKGGGTKDESLWNKHFNELKAYKEKYGHTNVPQNFKDNKQLGQWVNNQRTAYKKFKKNGKAGITKERIEMLESIDFEWVSQNKGGQKNETVWNKHFNELKAYKGKYGRTNVPRDFKDNKQLGQWVSTQRKEYKKFQENGKGKITKERIELLDSIGFQWSCHPDCAPHS